MQHNISYVRINYLFTNMCKSSLHITRKQKKPSQMPSPHVVKIIFHGESINKTKNQLLYPLLLNVFVVGIF